MEEIPMARQEIEGEVHIPIENENTNNTSSQNIGRQDDDTLIENRETLENLPSQLSIEVGNMNFSSEDIEKEDDGDNALIKIRRRLKSLSPLSPDRCIYRVPKALREVNSKAYTPQVVAIGPFHRGETHLQAMEEHKLRYLQTFLNRTNRSLKYYLKVVRTWEDKVRNCYAETIEISSDEFEEMILVDGSFTIELLLRDYFDELVDENDHIFNRPGIITNVCEDMMLLENQLPFFVLEGLFSFVSLPIKGKSPSLFELTHELFDFLVKFPDTIFRPRGKHFVDFIHLNKLHTLPMVPHKDIGEYEVPPTVTELYEAGVKFKKGTPSCCFFEINFTNGILEMTSFKIYGTTESLFRNLIAFEQCHYSYYKDRYIIQCMSLLNKMIKTPRDVELLIRHEIITARVSNSEAILALFNNISVGLGVGNNYYFSGLCKNLKAYCITPGRKWKAAWKRNYYNTILNTPWKILSVILAIVVLVLTIIQSVCSLISLH